MNRTDLDRILALHKEWILSDKAKGERADLRYTDLRYTNLRYTNLRGTDLRYTNLRGADLRDANLSDTDLRGTDLSYADLRGTDLSGTDLRGTDLSYADLRGTDLSGTDLCYADLRGAKLPDEMPTIKNIHTHVLDLVTKDGNSLEMDMWHTCDTTHCIAGWVAFDYPELDEKYGTCNLATQIYIKSSDIPAPDFHSDNEDAMIELKEKAKLEQSQIK